jgi:hypothetical protein
MTVVEAIVKVSEKSVPALIDAARRINLLLGIYTLRAEYQGVYGWWSWVTHDIGGSGMPKLAHDGIERSITAVLGLRVEVRRKVEAAMLWVRVPHNLSLEAYRSDVLRAYSSYWNAFECLVEAVDILRPRPTPSRLEKQAQIDGFMQQCGGRPTAADIQKCYQDIVNSGFVGKASYVLKECFGSYYGDRYAEECFRLSPRRERLYDIRNAINHGDIEAKNPNELLRVQARLGCLQRIVWCMFGCFIPLMPVDPKELA